MQQQLFPEDTSAFYARRAKEQADAIKQKLANGELPTPARLMSEAYRATHEETLKARQEQREESIVNPSPLVEHMKFPANDPITLARKQKLINGIG